MSDVVDPDWSMHALVRAGSGTLEELNSPKADIEQSITKGSWKSTLTVALKPMLTAKNLKVTAVTVATGTVYQFTKQPVVIVIFGVWKLFRLNFFLHRLLLPNIAIHHRAQIVFELVVITLIAIVFIVFIPADR